MLFFLVQTVVGYGYYYPERTRTPAQTASPSPSAPETLMLSTLWVGIGWMIWLIIMLCIIPQRSCKYMWMFLCRRSKYKEISNNFTYFPQKSDFFKWIEIPMQAEHSHMHQFQEENVDFVIREFHQISHESGDSVDP